MIETLVSLSDQEGDDMPHDPLRPLPLPSVRRLPLYLRYLKQIEAEGRQSVSCTQIAEHLNLGSIQVRKDLALTEIVGRPKVGYDTRALIDAI
jgi:redox-sensing transcriptional repressor